jgi:glycosyltransferase involved in cell wall biosynthesis
MKITYLAAGAAGMYCGACLHDNTLAAALLAQGADVLLVPTYTPIRTDEADVSQRRVLFGGINVYLQQLSRVFRYTPRWFDRMFDSPALLNALAKMNFSIDAAKLGGLTVSMLEGEQGRQRKEVAKLVDWLAQEARPDVVHLSNSMLSGMAREIRRRLDVPVVCSLAGEDIFLEKLSARHYQRARDVLRERAQDVTAFVSLNRYFADYMIDYLAIDRERVHVIPHGLNLAGHGTRRGTSPGEPFTIGYLARICYDKGLHQLVEAFKLLKDEPGLPPLRLRVAGYLGAGDRSYYAEVLAKVREWKLEQDFEYLGELDREQKVTFLQSLDVMSVPTVYRESKGLSILEAMANAVPVVLPAHGAFPELIEDTGGGLLCEPGDPASLARTLRQLVIDPSRAEELGRRAKEAVHDRYHAARMAESTLALYKKLLPSGAGQLAAQPTA